MLVTEGSPGLPTVGFVAGKRVGSAVDRNRAKRRMREAAARCALKADTVYVLVADRGVLDIDFNRLVEWVGSAAAADAVEELR
jgi:ribonuclease P protein component